MTVHDETFSGSSYLPYSSLWFIGIMELLDMPSESVAMVIEASVVVNGLDQAMKLRIVCSEFWNPNIATYD